MGQEVDGEGQGGENARPNGAISFKINVISSKAPRHNPSRNRVRQPLLRPGRPRQSTDHMLQMLTESAIANYMYISNNSKKKTQMQEHKKD